MKQLQLEEELAGDYRPVYLELKRLERDYPKVAMNQDRVVDDEMAILINTYAALLFAAQDEAPVVRSPKEIREALLVLSDVNGFRQLMTNLVQQFFPAVIIVIERLYFQNRAAHKYFLLPPSERIEGAKKIKPDEWLYPEARIDKVRTLTRKIWRHCVLTPSER